MYVPGPIYCIYDKLQNISDLNFLFCYLANDKLAVLSIPDVSLCTSQFQILEFTDILFGIDYS